MKKKFLAFVAAFAMMTLTLTACGPSSTTTTTTDDTLISSDEVRDEAAEGNENAEEAPAVQEEAPAADAQPAASADVTDRRDFIITLHKEYAPISCENFEKLVSSGFYNGLTFHRVVEDFMAQGGDPMGNGMGGSEENIKGEFISNGVDNKLSHQRGVVSMARSMDPDSASSQFFICYTDCSFLDGEYAAFGEVTEGMEVIDAFLAVPRTMGGDGAVSSPTSPIQIHEAVMIDPDENGNSRVKITMEEFIK